MFSSDFKTRTEFQGVFKGLGFSSFEGFLLTFWAAMEMEEDIGEDKDDQGDGDDEFYDDY